MKFPLRVGKGSVKLITIRSFEEEHLVADQIIAGCVVLVDFKYIDAHVKQRILSFLEGTLFGIDGKMLNLRDDLVVLLPNGALDEPIDQQNPMELIRQSREENNYAQ